MKNRGLIITDKAFAIHALTHCNYYRFSAYRFSFTESDNADKFRKDISFTQIWKLYEFDRSLRQLILEACERIEISARSRWAYELGHQYGPLGYLNEKNYKNGTLHKKTLKKLTEEMNRSKEVFITHHREKLQMTWPPSWVISEVASFGNISTLIGQHRDPAFRQSIADTYGLDEIIFCSLIHHLNILRNTAAHHCRLWNRRYALTFKLPKMKPSHLYENFNVSISLTGNPKERCIYNSLVIIIYMIQVIEPESTWPKRLVNLIFSLDPSLMYEMEFPADWKNRPIWSTLLQ